MSDIEHKFRDHQLNCEAHQQKHLRLAREVREGNPPIGWDTYDRNYELQARAHESSAAAWGRRAEAAGRLMFLVDHTTVDPEIMALHFDHTHQSMYEWACQHHRVEYTVPAGALIPDVVTVRGSAT